MWSICAGCHPVRCLRFVGGLILVPAIYRLSLLLDPRCQPPLHSTVRGLLAANLPRTRRHRGCGARAALAIFADIITSITCDIFMQTPCLGTKRSRWCSAPPGWEMIVRRKVRSVQPWHCVRLFMLGFRPRLVETRMAVLTSRPRPQSAPSPSLLV